MKTLSILTGLFAGCLTTSPAMFAQAFEYDRAGRLIRVAFPEGGGMAYTYDAADNLLEAVRVNILAAPGDVQTIRLPDGASRVSWSRVTGATQYVIERRPAAGGAWSAVATLGGEATTFIDTSAPANAEFRYRVAAVGADGRSVFAESGTASPRPAIAEGGVVNGASFERDKPVAAGSIVSIFGPTLGKRFTNDGEDPITEIAQTLPLPTSLGGYQVVVGGKLAPLLFVTPGQINAQLPWGTPPGHAPVIVTQADNGQSDPENITVAPVAPGFFTFDFGPGRVVAVNVGTGADPSVINGSIAQPIGELPGITTQPAPRGGVVILYANALGAVDRPIDDGANSADALRSAVTPVEVTIGGLPAHVAFAGLAPEFAGIFQLNVVIPQGVAPGSAVPIRIKQGQVQSRADVTLAVR
jgi:uncharacterized protein (TIGR03437 family)